MAKARSITIEVDTSDAVRKLEEAGEQVKALLASALAQVPTLIVTLPELAIGGQVRVRWDIGAPVADWRGFEGDVWRPLGALAELGGSVEVAP